MPSPGTSKTSGNLSLEWARQRERDIVRTILFHDLALTDAEGFENPTDAEVVSAPPLSDPALLNEPLSAALAMGLILTQCLKIKKGLKRKLLERSDPFFRLEALRNMMCAVKVTNNPVMGNPFSQTPGMDLKVDLDPGILAQPSIALHFCISKDESGYRDYYDDVFSVGWEPCPRVGGPWMMKNFDVVKATTSLYPKHSEDMFPTAIQELCTNQEDLDRLYCAKFRSHVQKSSEMSSEWAKTLRGDDSLAPYESLQLLCASEEPELVLIWFLNPHPTIERLYHGCLAPLCNAVKYRKPEEALEATEGESVHESEEDSEKAPEATDEEPIHTSENVDALRAEILQLKSDKSSLESMLRDRDDRIRNLADELRQVHKEHDAIVQAAEGIKRHKDLKPNELQKALNAIAKILR